ncbi:long-chain fatty acid--CoA ligase [Pseudomonas sp. gcc21]|uniref:class I adenylate-forming enzyme family protein n=1 Tax=Pseudomonas sp. gcc21 TaxID=2726989 RepID=UPI00145235BF|nr:long-chain-fatty-acid--CoA ligase [Pseudomonas sp. gcc21]QJD60663.1 long-chain fatty acid--CoA ligase [Pseudomonas sp. gcc21]
MILTELPDHNLERFGEYPFLYFNDRPLSNRQLLEMTSRLAAGLQAQGIKPGDRVMVCMANAPEVFVAYQAIMRAGAIVLPVMHVLHPREIGFIAEVSEASAIITQHSILPNVQQAVAGMTEPPLLLVSGLGEPANGTAPRMLDLHTLLQTASGALEHPQLQPDDTAVILFTSGTTGQPKGVMLTHRNLYSNAAAAAALADVEDEPAGVTLGVLPLAHIYGFTTANTLFLRGGAMVILPKFGVAEVCQAIQEHKVRRFSAVPAMIHALVADPVTAQYDLSSLEIVGSGSAPLPVSLISAFKARFGADIYEGYGLSEAAPTVSAHRVGETLKPGSVGRAFPGVELRIVDEAGQPLPTGEIGELLVRGENITPGYYRNEAATNAAIRDGWLHTGDVARLDEGGYLYIVDRQKDLILRGGFNIYPRDLEELISTHPTVAEVAVVGVPSERMGEEVIAVVVPARNAVASESELLAFCQEHLAKYKTPRAVIFVDALPRNGVGKVLKKTLREQVAEWVPDQALA